MASGNGRVARIGRDAVRARTGKTWSQWFRILDRAGARNMSHRDLFKAWNDARARRQWLPGERLVIRKATTGRSMRIAWSDGTTRVEVLVSPKGPGRCQVVVDHTRLEDAKAARRMKTYWRRRLDRLQEILEA